MAHGLLFGLLTAILYGSSDALLTYASRRVGTVRAVVVGLALSVMLLAGYAFLIHLTIPSDSDWMIRSAAIGAANGLSYLFFVQALRLGPIVVVSPISAGLGAMTVVFAVVFFGESVTLPQLAAVGITVVGCFLAAVVVEQRVQRPRLVGRGPIFMLVGITLYAAYTVALRDPVRLYGWEPTLLIARISAFLVVAGLGFFILRMSGRSSRATPAERATAPGGHPPVAEPAAPVVDAPARPSLVMPAFVLLLVGLFTTLGIIAYSLGLQGAPAWLVGLVVSTSPVIVVGSGMIFLKERLRPSQWLGVALIAAGLVLLSVA
ncbi:MAG: hypothetical protein QOH61_2311 [Chloroflexota bacterium]|nr:hypothetical protein [Chloroflexota bacterium]